MDVIELTLMLKSIGFRLDSIDYNAQRFSGGKISDIKTDDVTSVPAAKNANFISVDISCGKSKIISRMSYKLNNTDDQSSQCTCPKKETVADNSFWEIQSSGSFVNQRRSLNAATKKVSNASNQFYLAIWFDFWTVCFLVGYFYSHLFRTKTASIMIRHRICCRCFRKDRLQWLKCWHKLFWINTKMTLNLVKWSLPNAPTSKGNCSQNSPFQQPVINEKLIYSIINALGMKTFSVADNNHMPTTQIKVEDLCFETPMSSMNVTPDHVRSC